MAEFIFEGKRQPDRSADSRSLVGFAAAYLREAAPPNKARSTYQTERIHTKHLQAFAQRQGVTDLAGLDHAFFEGYKRWRSSEAKTNCTINKELVGLQH